MTKRTAQFGTVLLAFLVMTSNVRADDGAWSTKWAFNQKKFYIDVDEFDELGGSNSVSLNKEEAKWWIAYAAHTWTARTGGSLSITLEVDNSRTDAMCTDSDGDGELDDDGDEKSEIMVADKPDAVGVSEHAI